MVICLNLSPQSHLYQFCYYWKTKLKVVFDEEIKIQQEEKNPTQRDEKEAGSFSLKIWIYSSLSSLDSVCSRAGQDMMQTLTEQSFLQLKLWVALSWPTGAKVTYQISLEGTWSTSTGGHI